MMRIIVAAALALFSVGALAQGASIAGGVSGAPAVAGSGNITAAIDCRSFGQTAVDGGTLNIKYATPVMCWGTRSTVTGVAVNSTGWVPEVFFTWDWDDSSLGTVSRGGLTVDLGKSVGLVAAHAFLPSTYAETCNGGTNSSHTITLTVYSVVSGVRESDSATLTVCVENPATTWPAPVAYCNDADCSNDTFTGIVNPGTPTHGGNGTDLDTILEACNSGSKRILLEGGVTFSTSSGSDMGTNSCLIESYGGSKAILDHNDTAAHKVDLNSTCGGVRIVNVTLSGNDDLDSPYFGGGEGDGCLGIIDFDVATAAGSQLAGIIQSGGGGAHPDLTEWYFIKGLYDTHCSGCGPNTFYIQGDYLAWIGMEVSDSGEHMIRFPSWRYVVIDGSKFPLSIATKHLVAFRHECGVDVSPCIEEASAHTAAVTRSEFRPSDTGGVAIQLNHDGNDGSDATENYDMDFIANLFSKAVDADEVTNDYILSNATVATEEKLKRVRVIGNAADFTEAQSSSASLFDPSSADDQDFYVAANALSCHGCSSGTFAAMRGGSAGTTVVKNNVCYENGAATCDLFPSISESVDNLPVTSDPWDRDGVAPGSATTFDFADVGITSANTALKGQGVVSAYPVDVIDGESIPQSGDYDAGVDDE